MRYTILLLFFSLSIITASASTHIVNNGGDYGNNTLRYHVINSSPYDTITFSPSITGITLTQDEILIDKPLVILADHPYIFIKRDNGSNIPTFRIFHLVNSGDVWLYNLEIRFGQAELNPDYNASPGGGILVSDANCNLNIFNCIIHSNKAACGFRDYIPGGFFSSPGASGGGIYNSGNLHITDSKIYNNYAGNGGVWCGVKKDESAGTCDAFNGGNGGAICNTHRLFISNSIVDNNKAGDGGDWPLAPINWTGTGGFGGGIMNEVGAECTISSSLFYDNSSGMGTVVFDISSGNIWGGYSGSGGGICNYGTLAISNSTFSRNFTKLTYQNIGSGSALYSGTSSFNTLDNSIFYNNFREVSMGQDDLFISDLALDISYSLVGTFRPGSMNGLNNLEEINPQFIGNNCFQLSFNSPCINAGNPDTSGLPSYDLG